MILKVYINPKNTRKLASMAKLVRRHTSNVEIIGSTPIGSISFCLVSPRNELHFSFFAGIAEIIALHGTENFSLFSSGLIAIFHLEDLINI